MMTNHVSVVFYVEKEYQALHIDPGPSKIKPTNTESFHSDINDSNAGKLKSNTDSNRKGTQSNDGKTSPNDNSREDHLFSLNKILRQLYSIW
jgi:hypothetical protein